MDNGFGRLAGEEDYSEEYFEDSNMEDDLAEHGIHKIEEPSASIVEKVMEGYASGDDDH